MSMQALRERLAALNKSLNHRLAEKGDQVWTAEDQKAFDTEADELDRCRAQIERHQRLMDQEAQDNFKDAKRVDPKDAKRNDLQKGLDIFLRKSFKDMGAEEVTLVRNTMSTTTGSQGGFTVQTEVASSIVDALKDYGGVRRVADRVLTSGGNDMSWPTTDGTAEVGEWVAQNVAANPADPVFGTVPVNCFKSGSKVITVPIELLQDTQIDIIALLNNRMRDRIGRIQNQGFSIGTGTGQPFGVTVSASVGKTGTTGQTTSIIYDDLVDVIESVDVAYQTADQPLTWMTSQALRKVIRKIKDTSGRPIWTPSYEAGLAGGYSDELLGYPVNINNDMPAPAANAKSLSFGQHKKYLVRDAMEVVLFRFDDSAYMSKGQVGFLAWARCGGNLLDTAAVKLYQHSAT